MIDLLKTPLFQADRVKPRQPTAIDLAAREVIEGILEVREHLLQRAFKDGMHPGTVQFKWEIAETGAVKCWLETDRARPATPEERTEILELLARIDRIKAGELERVRGKAGGVDDAA